MKKLVLLAALLLQGCVNAKPLSADSPLCEDPDSDAMLAKVILLGLRRTEIERSLLDAKPREIKGMREATKQLLGKMFEISEMWERTCPGYDFSTQLDGMRFFGTKMCSQYDAVGKKEKTTCYHRFMREQAGWDRSP